MKTIVAFCIALLGFTSVYSQPNQGYDPNKVYTIVQQKPDFPGDINMWLANNIVYPNDAKINNIQGTVYVSFIVEKDGSVSTVKIIRGVQGGQMLDNEASRVVSMMPHWAPGMQDGKLVRVQYMVPIHFILANSNSDSPAQKQN